ncbi:MAG: hypothetical protein V1799_15115 [bacterium]
MKTIRRYTAIGILINLIVLSSATIVAQGVAVPLMLQGLDHTVPQGARSRAMGGTAYGMSGDVAAMFSNPAGLMGLQANEFHIGATDLLLNSTMTQEWYVNDYLDYFSLIVENKPEYGPIFDALNDRFRSDSLTKFRNGRLFNVKPYDDLQTNWQKSKSRFLPSLLAVAFPIEFKKQMIVLGLGYTEMINLDYYFQNNTAMDPYLGQFRPAPVPVFKNVNDSLKVRLFRNSAQREGSIYGVTPGIAFSPLNGINVGITYTSLSGITDDLEEQYDRSIIVIRTVKGRVDIDPVCQLDPGNYSRISKGKSHFSGSMINVGVNYKDEYFSIGGSFKPPYTITRSWDRRITTTALPGASILDSEIIEGGEESIKFPFSFGIGLAIFANEKVTVALDYESRNLTRTVLSVRDSTELNPWLNGSRYRFGVEYRPLSGLALRCGYREEAEVFARTGAAIMTLPERSKIFTGGLGFQISFVTIDLAYEFRRLIYFDSWESNTNFITDNKHFLMIETSFRF